MRPAGSRGVENVAGEAEGSVPKCRARSSSTRPASQRTSSGRAAMRRCQKSPRKRERIERQVPAKAGALAQATQLGSSSSRISSRGPVCRNTGRAPAATGGSALGGPCGSAPTSASKTPHTSPLSATESASHRSSPKSQSHPCHESLRPSRKSEVHMAGSENSVLEVARRWIAWPQSLRPSESSLAQACPQMPAPHRQARAEVGDGCARWSPAPKSGGCLSRTCMVHHSLGEQGRANCLSGGSPSA
mmetsp:Transcript_109230/g.314591  ORF Transcript_109230/g.314591 Transcript_109230/m.314591 type:complete len:246 (+) Transcript_109230:1394-2131(+)